MVLEIVMLLSLSSSGASDDPRAAGVFVDARDGERYPLVDVAGLRWFARDLAHATPGSFCYGDEPALCARYGRLYRWEAATRACPPGSHLATENEWLSLERAIGIPDAELLAERNRGRDQGARLKPGGETGFRGALRRLAAVGGRSLRGGGPERRLVDRRRERHRPRLAPGRRRG